MNPGLAVSSFEHVCSRPWSSVSVWLVLASSLVSLRSLPAPESEQQLAGSFKNVEASCHPCLPVSEASCPTSVPGVIWPLPPFWPVLLPASPPVVPPAFPLFPGPLAGSCPSVSAPAVAFTWAALPALYLAAVQPLLPRYPLERSCLTACLPCTVLYHLPELYSDSCPLSQ